jgi:hypothetical protein
MSREEQAVERRDLLKLSGLALMGLACPPAALAQNGPPAGDLDLTFLHCWSDEKGETHVMIRPLAKTVKPIPLTGDMNLHFDSRPLIPLHTAPQRMFVITLQGDFELEASDGTRLKAPPSGISFDGDTTGRGHAARLKDAVNIDIGVPADFDVLRWARGE